MIGLSMTWNDSLVASVENGNESSFRYESEGFIDSPLKYLRVVRHGDEVTVANYY